MKISISRLKQIIKEEVLKEQVDVMAAPGARKTAAAGALAGIDPLESLMKIIHEMDDDRARGDVEAMSHKVTELLRKGEDLRKAMAKRSESDDSFAMDPGSEEPTQITSDHHTYGLKENKFKQIVKKELVDVLISAKK